MVDTKDKISVPMISVQSCFCYSDCCSGLDCSGPETTCHRPPTLRFPKHSAILVRVVFVWTSMSFIAGFTSVLVFFSVILTGRIMLDEFMLTLGLLINQQPDRVWVRVKKTSVQTVQFSRLPPLAGNLSFVHLPLPTTPCCSGLGPATTPPPVHLF